MEVGYSPRLGVNPKLPKKVLPNGQTSDGKYDYDFVLSEEDKEENNYAKIKKLVYHYEWIGRQQVNKKRDIVAKKFNLAYGVVDVNDYVKEESEFKTELTLMDGQPMDYDLKFYPIIPNIVHALTSELSKHYINYSAIAINREATNEVLDSKNNMLRSILVSRLQAIYDAELANNGVTPESQPEIYQQQQEVFKSLPKVQNYFNKEFRLEVEKWANHQLQIDEKRFRMKDLEKQALFNKIVTDLPFVHINLLEGDYKPEILDPRYTYYLRSPHTDDISEAVMFGWFEYESPLNLITRFGDKLREEDIEKLNNLHIHYRTLLTIDSKARYNMDVPGILESAQNYLAFREIANTSYKDSKYRGEEYKERLVEVSNMYIQVPRKLGKLTMVLGEEVTTSIVDDTYKITYKPKYDTSIQKEKNEDNLIFGEHISWFYINELWRCAKINLSTNPNPDNSDDIWIILEKFPIQLSKAGRRYGSYIPIHGGPKTNRYNEIITIVDKCKPWQVFYNYLWNRNEQILKNEIGKFFAMNQAIIPQESMGEEWGQNNLLQWVLAARDIGVAPTDTSLANTNNPALAATGGYGQVIDLSVTDQVLQKAKLAEICKNECLMSVGISPQFLADISPSETATGIAQGINRSATQIKYLYDEHFATFELVRQTMLEFAKYTASQATQVEQTYINDEGERVIFQIPSDLLIHQLGVYVSANMDDNIVIENVRRYVLADNTIGADIMDKVALVSAKSVSEIYSKLKDVTKNREIKEQQMLQREEANQQRMIEEQTKQLQMKLEEEARQRELDRTHEKEIAEIKVIGQSQFSEGSGYEELMRLREQQLKERATVSNILSKARNDSNREETERMKAQISGNVANDKLNLEKEKIQLQREKILADLQKSRDALTIAKVNKP